MPSWSLQPQGVDRGDTEDIKNYIIEHVKVLSAIKKKQSEHAKRAWDDRVWGSGVSSISL